MNFLYWIIIVIVVVFITLIIVGIFIGIYRRTKDDGQISIKQLKERAQKDKEDMKNVSCDYSYNLSNDVVLVYKLCDGGYDRYYIPLASWFKNNKINQSVEDNDLCIRKAFNEIYKRNSKYYLDYSTRDIWFTVRCIEEEWGYDEHGQKI